ncbi:aspartyl-phosphate phosphatase Spo0E family protein [Paenibacillus sp. UMB7766-LJ446]|uniref:aspartyl-phosphate phosphatase Spo0E family protein n=1 Tax=Paenibacillus TaxID=44249 RepID=UPI00254EF43A|nr:aspartyl-phosphate phosphatase Spo0E family protein [Paenibacillus sp. UMB7766-LJ446]MDK8193150.1 aspartyl-phosphate phosphatase Spo0E family protein [Paenibacillus sp. UMB7766-LJ446]
MEKQDKETLSHKIETKRSELIKVGEQYGLCSPEAIKLSEELDNILNLYNRLNLSKKISI